MRDGTGQMMRRPDEGRCRWYAGGAERCALSACSVHAVPPRSAAISACLRFAPRYRVALIARGAGRGPARRRGRAVPPPAAAAGCAPRTRTPRAPRGAARRLRRGADIYWITATYCL